MKGQTVDNILEEINKYDALLRKLYEGDVYKILVEEANKQISSIDSQWHLQNDSKNIDELRVRKMAFMYVVNIEKHFKTMIENLQTRVNDLTDKTKITKDWDNA